MSRLTASAACCWFMTFITLLQVVLLGMYDDVEGGVEEAVGE